MSEKDDKHRPIRSFVRRKGRMTFAQKNAFKILWSDYGLELDDSKLDFSKVFANDYPCILEIGFGMGEALIELAKKFPEKNFIGIDVHQPGVGALLKNIKAYQLKNIRVFCADAIEVITLKIPDESLEGIHIFFPDPWPKKKHHKRRLIQPNFMELLRSKLKLAGYIHLATDWEDYAKHMLEVITADPGFINAAGRGRFSPRPESRPLTKFEQRGERLGHKVWDLIFIKEM